MFGKRFQVVVLQYAGKSTRIAGWILILYVVLVWYFLPFLNFGVEEPIAFFRAEFLTLEGILKALRFFVPPIVMIWLGGRLEASSAGRRIEMNNQLIGLVKSYEKIPLTELASKVGLSTAETERALAVIRSKRSLDIAIADGYAMLEREICKNCPFKKQQSKVS